MEKKCLILETLRPSASITNVKGSVGTNSEVYNGILSLLWRLLAASVSYVMSHHLFNVSADVQKQKFAVIVSGRVIGQEHVKRGIAVVVRRSIIP